MSRQKSRYEIILQAANHIEKAPEDWKFDTIVVPKGPKCGTPGCAAGWISYFGGATNEHCISEGLEIALGYADSKDGNTAYGQFSDQMHEVNRDWIDGTPAQIAGYLRTFALRFKGKPRRKAKVAA
jgi:hypothetical protein